MAIINLEEVNEKIKPYGYKINKVNDQVIEVLWVHDDTKRRLQGLFEKQRNGSVVSTIEPDFLGSLGQVPFDPKNYYELVSSIFSFLKEL